MLKFKDVSQTERGEVVRLASELLEREHAEVREQAAVVAAAEEIGIPEDYLERAAQTYQEKRIASAHQKQATRKRFWVGGGIAAAAGVGWLLLRPAPPAPAFSLSPATMKPVVSVSAGTLATVGTENNTFVLTVDKFAPTNNRYSANLNLSLPKTSLASYRQMSFTVQGKGTIPQVRLFFEGGNLNERWKGPDIPVSETPRTVTVSLDAFIRQQRVSDTVWKDFSKGRVGEATTLSIKSGAPFNPPTANGTIGISTIEFK